MCPHTSKNKYAYIQAKNGKKKKENLRGKGSSENSAFSLMCKLKTLLKTTYQRDVLSCLRFHCKHVLHSEPGWPELLLCLQMTISGASIRDESILELPAGGLRFVSTRLVAVWFCEPS